MTTTTAPITRELLLSKYEDNTLASFITSTIIDDGSLDYTDMDSCVYDFISEWDELFTEQDGWYFEESEDAPAGWYADDIKDQIRDEVERLVIQHLFASAGYTATISITNGDYGNDDVMIEGEVDIDYDRSFDYWLDDFTEKFYPSKKEMTTTLTINADGISDTNGNSMSWD